MNVDFTVPGRPRPQGSKRPIPTKAGIRLVEQVKGLPDWRAQVRHEGWNACPRGPVDVPVSMHVTFVFSRPKGHFKASGELRSAADPFPSKRSVGDVDKLLRAVLDALTGACFTDDSLVVSVIARKVYGFPERCEITATDDVTPLDFHPTRLSASDSVPAVARSAEALTQTGDVSGGAGGVR